MTLDSRHVTTWRLTLEPSRLDVAWSLLRARGSEPVRAFAAGIVRGTQDEAALTFAIPPQGSAAAPFSLTANPLMRPDLERDAGRLLGLRLLPAEFRSALTEVVVDAHDEPLHRVQIAVRGWLAQVPWEAVTVDPHRDLRLIECATLMSAMSPGLGATRIRNRPAGDPNDPGIAIVDAGPPSGESGENLLIYPGGYPDRIAGPKGLARGDRLAPGGRPMSAQDFAEQLNSKPWSRLLYVGHISAGRRDDPGSAALVFQDRGRRQHFSASQWLADPARWPAPERVALIGCGSDDAQFLEASGLPVAAVNAGAQLVTCTRWTIPTDRSFRPHRPATDLALATHRAHCALRPIATLRQWQLGQLAQWRSHGSRRHSPLFWASVTSYRAPANPT